MNVKNLIFASLALLIYCTGCRATTPSTTISLDSSLNGLTVQSNIEVIYTVSSKAEIEVIADESDIKNIVTEVNNNNLLIYYRGNKQPNDIKVLLKAPALQSITTSGNSEVLCENTLKIGKIELRAQGNSEIYIKGITSQNAEFEGNGNSRIKIGNLTCKNISVNASGNADITCKDYNGKNISIAASGNAEVTMKNIAATALTASTSGNAEVELKGRVSTVTFSASGVSEIKASNLTANTGTASASGNATVSCRVLKLTKQSTGFGHIKNS